MTKLALLLLAIPASGAFAAADYSTLISSLGNFSVNDVKPDTLLAGGSTKLGTASDPNVNHIGWSTPPAQQVLVEWTDSGLVFAGVKAPLVLGGLSSYNTLDIDDVVKLNVGTLMMGQGALIGGTGEDAALVDTTKLANNNVLNVSDAGYQTIGSSNVSTMLRLTATSGTNYVGRYGNNNVVNITDGAQLTANSTGLVIGASDAKNPTYGCNNAVNVSGSVSVTVLGHEGTIASYFTAAGLKVGDYGSNNSLNVSDKASSYVGGDLHLGEMGDNNAITIASTASLTVGGTIDIGCMPDATGNALTLDGSELIHSSVIDRIVVGRFGSNNSFTATDSTISSRGIIVGYGDYSIGDAAADGTKGYVASEGNGNSLSITDSLVKLHNVLVIGINGSNNTGTISGSGLYSEWTDAGTTPDGKVQFDEISVSIGSISLGIGMAGADSSEDLTALGCNNSLTIDNASAFKAGDILVGNAGSGNSLTIQGGTIGSVSNVFVGNGDTTLTAYGSNNSFTLTGKDTKLTGNAVLGNGLGVGTVGSNNKVLVSAGATLITVGSADTSYIGLGFASTATVDNSAFGCGNSLTVTGEGSSASITANDTLILGYYGSNNKIEVSDKAKLTILGDFHIGANASQFGTVLNPKNIFSQGNQVVVSGGATLTVSNDIFLGNLGINNSMVVTGEDTYVQADDITVGHGSPDSVLFGCGNSLEVTDNAVLVGDSISIGRNLASDYCGSNNTLTVSNGGIVVSTGYVVPNDFSGTNNIVRIKNGTIALPGKVLGGSKITWEDLIVNGFITSVKGSSYSELVDGTSFVDKGAIQIWDATAGKYVTAKAADLSIKYYSSETEAKAATGYTGLAGYTIVKQANDLSRLAWAGDVYDGGNGSYCSSWYGWFYNDASYGDYIMSYNNYSWQFVDPSSTEQNVYLYDYSLSAWLYTNSTYFENKWFYNFTTKAWVQLGK
jgi:hypothetical protein